MELFQDIICEAIEQTLRLPHQGAAALKQPILVRFEVTFFSPGSFPAAFTQVAAARSSSVVLSSFQQSLPVLIGTEIHVVQLCNSENASDWNGVKSTLNL